MTDPHATQIPRPGMFATVRNRRGIVSAVEPYDGETGRLHLVHLEYKDDELPTEERLLWELEPKKTLLPPTELPGISGTGPMPADDFDAVLRASRWTAASPYLDPDGDGPLDRLPISSPFHGAVQVEDFQLVPLLKALRMPRVNLLIADDVGLGKTIEAGLILTELLLRRRIQRVLILTPGGSLRLQWRDEMWEKFALQFELVDRGETDKLRRRLGMDANPWRSFSRIITSYHYLRQSDVLESFIAACRTPEGSPHLPWDLLILVASRPQVRGHHRQRRFPMKYGARNNVKARVKSVQKGDIMSLIHFEVLVPGEMSSVITTESVADLDLKPGDEVKLVIKAIHVLPVKE